METGDAPPYPHGDGGKLRQVVLLDRSGQTVAHPEHGNAYLLTGGRWLEVEGHQLRVKTGEEEGANPIPLPSGCERPGIQGEGEWILIRCANGAEPSATLFTLEGRQIWQQKLAVGDGFSLVAMDPENGLIWLAEKNRINGYKVPASPSPTRAADPSSSPESAPPLNQSDRVLAGIRLGAIREEVRQILGEPSRTTLAGDGTGEAWQYVQGLTVVFCPKDGTVFTVVAQPSVNGCTARSICLGDTVAEVQQAYGDPYTGEAVRAFEGARVYADRKAAIALIFGFDPRGQVDLIELRDLFG